VKKSKSYFYSKKIVLVDKTKVEEKSVGYGESSDSKVTEIHFIKYAKKLSVDKDLIEQFDIQHTGDGFDNKVCDRCFRYLPTSFFSNNRIKKNNVITKRPSCIDCRKIKDGISVSVSDKKIWENKKPSIFDLFECPICKKVTISGISKVVLDHNHHNGKVRGYLCESCNTGIGRFDDNPEIVLNAIKWLKQKN